MFKALTARLLVADRQEMYNSHFRWAQSKSLRAFPFGGIALRLGDELLYAD
jgi:hypothetical protein